MNDETIHKLPHLLSLCLATAILSFRNDEIKGFDFPVIARSKGRSKL